MYPSVALLSCSSLQSSLPALVTSVAGELWQWHIMQEMSVRGNVHQENVLGYVLYMVVYFNSDSNRGNDSGDVARHDVKTDIDIDIDLYTDIHLYFPFSLHSALRYHEGEGEREKDRESGYTQNNIIFSDDFSYVIQDIENMCSEIKFQTDDSSLIEKMKKRMLNDDLQNSENENENEKGENPEGGGLYRDQSISAYKNYHDGNSNGTYAPAIVYGHMTNSAGRIIIPGKLDFPGININRSPGKPVIRNQVQDLLRDFQIEFSQKVRLSYKKIQKLNVDNNFIGNVPPYR